MSVPYGFYPENGFVIGVLARDEVTWNHEEAQELHDVIKADPGAFLAELQAAVDEARKQRSQG